MLGGVLICVVVSEVGQIKRSHCDKERRLPSKQVVFVIVQADASIDYAGILNIAKPNFVQEFLCVDFGVIKRYERLIQNAGRLLFDEERLDEVCIAYRLHECGF